MWPHAPARSPCDTTFASTELMRESDAATLLARWAELDVPTETRAQWEQHGTREALRRYLDRAHATGRATANHHGLSGVPVTYQRSKTAIQAQTGARQFAVGGLSMQGLPRQLRHTLAHNLYHEIDIVNAHPTILRQWCAREHIAVPALEGYVDDRDAKLAELVRANASVGMSFGRDHAKQVALAILNGGSRDADELAAHPDWLTALRNEMRYVHGRMLERRELSKLKAIIARDSNAGNVGGSLANHVMCDVEDRIVDAAVSFLGSRNVSCANIVLVFDGFMIPRGLCDVDDAFLGALAAHVRSKTGYSVRFVEKAIDSGIDLTKLSRAQRPATRMAANDSEVAAMIEENLPDRVRFSGGGRTFARTRAGIWTDNAKDVAGVLKKIVTDSGIKRPDKNGLPQEYASNDVHARAIINLLVCDPPTDPSFPERLRAANLRRLFFADGVFDFDLGVRGEFRAETPDDMAIFRIPRPFPRDEGRNPDLEAEVRRRILESAFGPAEVVDNVLEHLARALTCEVDDKQIIVIPGERNSGKGNVSAAVENAFGPYVTTTNSNSFLHTTSFAAGGDEAKKLSWLLACAGRRIVFTQEIK
jgi:hypothetical protein